MPSVVDGFLRSPLSGIAPWVLLAVLSGPGRFEEAAAAAFGMSVLLTWIGHRRGIAVHLLEVFGMVFFGVLTALAAFASPGTIHWLEVWAGELTNVALALFATVTLLIGRPFTLAYAKDSTPQEVWGSQTFRRVNYVISAVWAGAFFCSAAVGCYGDAVLHDPDEFWTGWILQLAALLFAVSFTDRYPSHVRGQQGESTDPAPSMWGVLDWVPTFVLVTGVIGLATDSLSTTVGTVLIVVGAVGAAAVRRWLPKAG
ncbi:hypothetical protein MMAD_37410 [Mycolicibacterium madagascariense]|uniref:Uncharacterized protein n=1 Tax=Mycolicibacterium madagascariense TaxID=212765 RepID=A0A7I7XJP5_9MYCO|nr:hypothetical protein MMAD_37410 [Mycolicibacterium madagascariense]